jgi:DNA polymerase-4
VAPRIVLHADMDAFYASIEQRDRPELRGKPVIVGAASRRGVVAAASYEARKFGVRSAMPGFRARELCPEGVFLPSDMKKYAAVSEVVHEVFTEFTPRIEPLALDEAFLDITGSARLFGGPLALGQALRARVRERTGLAVSCGIAENKLVAKIACSLAKPDGLRVVPPQETRGLLAPLPIRWLWGVGPVLEQTLLEAGFRTLGELASADPRELRGLLGERAESLVLLAQGVDDRPVEPARDPKSCGEENTFERDVSARDEITAALSSHAQEVARRLRGEGLRARTVTIKIKLARARKRTRSRSSGEQEPSYPLLTRSRTLAEPTDDGALLRKVAIALWDAAGIAEPVRLLGVSTSGLTRAPASQLDLFEAAPAVRARKLGPALDHIRERFGASAIGLATGNPEKQTPSDRKKR